MAVAAHQDMSPWPLSPDQAHEATQIAADLRACRRLSRMQDHGAGAAGGGVIDVDRQETALAMMRIKERKLLMAVTTSSVSSISSVMLSGAAR